jgi:protein TonB
LGDGPGPFIPGATDDGPRILDATHPGHIAKPVSVSQGVMEAALIHRVQPAYPVIAKFNHISGPVVLHAIIGTDGTIQKLEVVSGNSILAMAAVTAVRDWRYRPTLLSGNPVEVDTYITVNFVLE